jgi:hypothetical protein
MQMHGRASSKFEQENRCNNECDPEKQALRTGTGRLLHLAKRSSLESSPGSHRPKTIELIKLSCVAAMLIPYAIDHKCNDQLH